jgi:hypothetical protein
LRRRKKPMLGRVAVIGLPSANYPGKGNKWVPLPVVECIADIDVDEDEVAEVSIGYSMTKCWTLDWCFQLYLKLFARMADGAAVDQGFRITIKVIIMLTKSSLLSDCGTACWASEASNSSS